MEGTPAEILDEGEWNPCTLLEIIHPDNPLRSEVWKIEYKGEILWEHACFLRIKE